MFAVVAQLVEHVIGYRIAHLKRNFLVNPELRLISLKGQDRGESNLARTTDKGR